VSVESTRSFEATGSQFLDRAMPLPVAATCAYAAVFGEHELLAGGLAVVFIAINIALNSAIERRLRRGVSPGRLLDVGRAGISMAFLPPIAWASGPDAEAWLVALPALVAMPYLLQLRQALVASISLALLILLAWQRLSPPSGVWLEPALAMSALVLVCTPMASAMRERGRNLLEMTAALERSKAAAEHASVAKSSFLAHMSHELRTPLGAISGYADLLGDPRTGQEVRGSSIGVIQRNCGHLLELVNQILDLAKIEAGELIIDSAPASVGGVVEDVASLMRVQASNRRLEFRVDYATPLPATIQTDAFRLRQILVNLVGNAIKFTREGSVEIRVTFSAEPRELWIDVIDTGAGISEDNLESLFQPFVQADGSTAREFGGTGLGLAISQHLAGLLGGALEVESAVGSGSRFRVRLPVTPGEALHLTAAPAGQGREARKPVPLSCDDLVGVRVLLAEDFPDNALLITMHLQRAGIFTVSVENGIAAIAAVVDAQAAGEPFDVVLMDMQMPLLDGYSAASKLRAEGFAVPIIALTAHAMAGDREPCLRAGCDGYLAKPVEIPALIAAIRDHLPEERRESMQDSSPEVTPPVSAADDSDRAAAPDPGVPLDVELAEIGALYGTRLAERTATIEAAWRSDDRAQMTFIAHQLAGSAGMYGYDACGDAARALEQSLRAGAAPDVIDERISTLREAAGEFNRT